MTGLQPRLFTDPIATDPEVGLSDEWYTPRHVIEAARAVLGGIDLDPASCATAQEVVQAGTYYTKEQDGLSLPWFGRVWLNPPYSRGLMTRFVDRLSDAYVSNEVCAAVVLTNNGHDTPWGQKLLAGNAACFMRGRIDFWNPQKVLKGNPFRQTIYYLGPDVARFTEVFSAFGVVKV